MSELATATPETLNAASFLGGFNFKEVALMVLKPLILSWLDTTLRSDKVKSVIELTDDQINRLEGVLSSEVDKIVK